MDETKLRLVVTGHRPQRITDEKRTRARIREELHRLQPAVVIQGMAAGVDVWTAAEAWHEGIPFHSVKPWQGHKAVPDNIMNWLMRNSSEVTVLSQQLGYPGPWIFENRNRWMIDRADIVLAVWDGVPKGGTYNAVTYARSKGLPIVQIKP